MYWLKNVWDLSRENNCQFFMQSRTGWDTASTFVRIPLQLEICMAEGISPTRAALEHHLKKNSYQRGHCRDNALSHTALSHHHVTGCVENDGQQFPSVTKS